MPLTPFHFGPSALVGAPFKRKIDLPAFVLANVVVDVEPGVVLILGLNYPLHGYLHTFVFGGILGAFFGDAVYLGRSHIHSLMYQLKLPYFSDRKIAIYSGVLGIWFHVLIDSLYHQKMTPFFPLKTNPIYGLIDAHRIVSLCLYSFVLALLTYVLHVIIRRQGRAGVAGRDVLLQLAEKRKK